MIPAGSRLRRREPQGDDWDRIVVRGVWGMTEGEDELVVSPVAFGHAPVTVDLSGGGLADYVPDDPIPEDAGVVALRERLDELGWSTDPAELEAVG